MLHFLLHLLVGFAVHFDSPLLKNLLFSQKALFLRLDHHFDFMLHIRLPALVNGVTETHRYLERTHHTLG